VNAVDSNSSFSSLAQAAQRLEVAVPEDSMELLDKYCHTLWKWNERLNLTRHTDYEKFVGHDLADTLALSELIDVGEHVLDVGTGGGVPGIPLSILRPDLQVELCDSVAKKARAVKSIVQEVDLDIPIHHQRAEAILEQRPFDTVVVRAVAKLAKLLTWFEPCWNNIGQLLVIKGPNWVNERAEARGKGKVQNLNIRRVAEYKCTGMDAPSVVLRLWPK